MPLTVEQQESIRQEETIRANVQKEIAEAGAPKSRFAKINGFLETKVGFWLLATVLTGLVTAAYGQIQIYLSRTPESGPAYDQHIVDEIRRITEELMTVYAVTGMGVKKDTFDKRVDRYNQIIGSIDAIIIMSESRSVPDPATQKVLKSSLSEWQGNKRSPPPSQADALYMAATECATERHVAGPMRLPDSTSSLDSNTPDSVADLLQVSAAIALLRDTDCVHGLNNAEVAVNKSMTFYYLSRALHYENDRQRRNVDPMVKVSPL
ncbi:hypothetical protein [Paraburkholderia caribensis]|uniref:hypothetical protein n=1 Tax=Paraburkholderia caribensis TaxID=75105 RepID=UPI001319F343|nr:hypothetical protein [Paraburkholderia caribensis]